LPQLGPCSPSLSFWLRLARGGWVSVVALALAFITWRRRDSATLVASAVVACAGVALWIYLIPATTGSELVLAVLALVSASIASLSIDRLIGLRREALDRVTLPNAD